MPGRGADRPGPAGRGLRQRLGGAPLSRVAAPAAVACVVPPGPVAALVPVSGARAPAGSAWPGGRLRAVTSGLARPLEHPADRPDQDRQHGDADGQGSQPAPPVGGGRDLGRRRVERPRDPRRAGPEWPGTWPGRPGRGRGRPAGTGRARIWAGTGWRQPGPDREPGPGPEREPDARRAPGAAPAPGAGREPAPGVEVRGAGHGRSRVLSGSRRLRRTRMRGSTRAGRRSRGLCRSPGPPRCPGSGHSPGPGRRPGPGRSPTPRRDPAPRPAREPPGPRSPRCSRRSAELPQEQTELPGQAVDRGRPPRAAARTLPAPQDGLWSIR